MKAYLGLYALIGVLNFSEAFKQTKIVMCWRLKLDNFCPALKI